ncbi:hypothetical protein SPSIL_012240 [Sporomusa silvacetica DSM 10669]|uniref:Uncharacterized protein n=1 Tax=Sporomusa silvacetica DSM 10669 TaxID=1123289 RepID=A0ABZ3IHM5_9FIRM|nr:hypothetical protein [Sporomusa silvacetica]OZC17482.1 hypothetical protein SPSIL_32930 [Sporomusa silvacetica DSM 10669]
MTRKITFLGLLVAMFTFTSAVTTASPAPTTAISPPSPTIAAYAANTDADTDQTKPLKKKCCCKDEDE